MNPQPKRRWGEVDGRSEPALPHQATSEPPPHIHIQSPKPTGRRSRRIAVQGAGVDLPVPATATQPRHQKGRRDIRSMAATDGRGAPLSSSRVAVARGLVHAAQVAAGLAVLLCAFADLPWAAAAAPACILRVAASFLAPPRLCFLAAHVILIALATLFRRDAASSSPPSADPPGSSGDAQAQHPFLALLGPPLPPVTEAAEPSGEEEAPPDEALDGKEAAHHARTVRAQPPRRAMSEKTGGAAGGTARAASAELRRAKSENGRRRQRRSAAAAAAPAPVELGMDDGEAFRLAVEAFIAKQQTWFHREESLIARTADDAGGEDGTAIAGAAVAVK
jgi:hypothetical protein